VSDPLAAGIHALAIPGLADGFAAVLGGHRFLNNPRVSLSQLIEPAHHAAHQWRRQSPDAWGLVIHDWSSLKYPGHASKTDQARLSHRRDRGYELTTLLLVDGRQGDPVAPLELRLRAARRVYSTRQPAPDHKAFRIDEAAPSMQAVAALDLGGPLVHVIDREADALAQYRDWQAAGRSFLVRAKGGRKVRWQDQELSLADLAERLPMRRCREVTYRGQTAVQRAAETEVTLERPAWRHRRRGGQTVNERVAGPALTLRLVVSRVCDGGGRTLAVWYLLTNLPAAVETATAVLWYYWRWRIESLFKLLKSAGHQVEHWQQRNGEALARRLLTAATACGVVWRLVREPSAQAETLRSLLIRLSGRQMKYGRRQTLPALLAGLGVLLAMLEALEQHRVEQLQQFKKVLFDASEEDSG
jgi:DDE family transposase